MKYYKTLLFSLFLTTMMVAQKPTLILPVGHMDAITCLNYSNDGQYIVSGSKDRTIKVWTAEGRLLRNFPSHETEVVDAFFSPDDRYVISRSDSFLYIWNFNGSLIWKSTCLSPPASNSFTDYDPIQFSPDGQSLLSIDADTVPYLLDINQLTKKELPGLGRFSLAFSPDGQQIIANDTQNIQLYNRRSGQIKEIQVDNAAAYISPSFKVLFKDDKNIAIVFADEQVYLSLDEPELFKPYFISTETNLFERFSESYLNEKGTDEDGNIAFEKTEHMVTFFSTGGPARGPTIFRWANLLLNPQQTVLAFSNSKKYSLLFIEDDIMTSTMQLDPQTGDRLPGNPIEFSSDGQHLALLHGQHLALYDFEKMSVNLFYDLPKVSSSFPYGNWPQAFAFDPKKKEMLLGSETGGINIYDYEGTLIKEIGNQSVQKPFSVSEASNKQLVFSFYDGDDRMYSVDSLLSIAYDLEDSHVVSSDSVQKDMAYTRIQNNDYSELLEVGVTSTAAFGYDDIPGAAPYMVTGAGTVSVYSDNPSIPSFSFQAYASNSDLCFAQGKYLLTSSFREQPVLWDFGCLTKVEYKPLTQYSYPDMALSNPCRLDTLDQLPPRTIFLDSSEDKPLVLHKEKDELVIEDYRGVNMYVERQKKNFQLLNVENNTSVDFVGHEFKTLGATLINDDQFVISWSEDRSCKIWDATTGKELLTLFWVNEKDWVVIAPNGLFDASPGMMDFLYYTVENEIIELEQLKARYYEPGLLPKTLAYSEERIRQVDQLDVLPLYPEIVNPQIKNNTLSFQLKARNGGVGQTSVFINGKEVIQDANPPQDNAQRATDIDIDLDPFNNYFLSTPNSTNIISIRTYNEAGWLKSQALDIEYKLSAPNTKGRASSSSDESWKADLDPKLYVISVGTSNYTGSTLDLKYADQDATMIAKAMNYVGGALFSSGDSLEVHCLSTANATATGLEETDVIWEFAEKKNIEATFKSIKEKAKAEDVIVVYMSGHGVTYGSAEQAQFYYLTQGIASEDLSDPSIREAYTISSEELTAWINDIPALKQVLIIDACNSGKVVESMTSGSKALNSGQIRALDRMKDRTGMFILSGSASDKVSYEASEYGQGLLTYALLQGMLGVATRKDATGNDMVDVMELFQHARNSVPELAASIRGIQTPMLGFPSQGASFDIGILDDVAKSKIPIGNKKPVMIRSVFINELTLLDDLELARLLEIEFREEGEEGANADLIYVDVNEYPQAYRLGALYKPGNEAIDIRVNLFQGKKLIKELTIRPTDNPKRLVKTIVREVKRALR
ncbi:MAG: hypothetical protein Sapg2KO_13860 [Saprospiraceae bacterium]